MSYVCLSSPAWSTAGVLDSQIAALLPALLAHAPRVVVDGVLVWADARGLHAATLAEQLLDVLRVHGVRETRAGTALTPIAAQVAATWAPSMRDGVMRSMSAGDIAVRVTPPITSVRPGRERVFLADFPITVLSPPAPLAALLDGIGVDTCGRLAALDAESVEVRLGPDGVDIWERARGRDARWLFRTPLRAMPSASLEWTEYALRNTERLLFVANSLLASVCAALVEQGERARDLSLVFSLANRKQLIHPLRSARPSADQKRWLRLVREALEGGMELPDAVVGFGIRVDAVTGNNGSQGDLFDRGFASADAVETTLAQLADDHGELIVAPVVGGHPLADQRTVWNVQELTGSGQRVTGNGDDRPNLALQLLPIPQSIAVTTEARRDHEVPIKYRDAEGWHTLVDVAGPDRVSGGQWDGAYAREYFRCVREDGGLVWLYGQRNEWFLHGWWD
jgi:hypothetical protein